MDNNEDLFKQYSSNNDFEDDYQNNSYNKLYKDDYDFLSIKPSINSFLEDKKYEDQAFNDSFEYLDDDNFLFFIEIKEVELKLKIFNCNIDNNNNNLKNLDQFQKPPINQKQPLFVNQQKISKLPEENKIFLKSPDAFFSSSPSSFSFKEKLDKSKLDKSKLDECKEDGELDSDDEILPFNTLDKHLKKNGNKISIGIDERVDLLFSNPISKPLSNNSFQLNNQSSKSTDELNNLLNLNDSLNLNNNILNKNVHKKNKSNLNNQINQGDWGDSINKNESTNQIDSIDQNDKNYLSSLLDSTIKRRENQDESSRKKTSSSTFYEDNFFDFATPKSYNSKILWAPQLNNLELSNFGKSYCYQALYDDLKISKTNQAVKQCCNDIAFQNGKTNTKQNSVVEPLKEDYSLTKGLEQNQKKLFKEDALLNDDKINNTLTKSFAFEMTYEDILKIQLTPNVIKSWFKSKEFKEKYETILNNCYIRLVLKVAGGEDRCSCCIVRFLGIGLNNLKNEIQILVEYPNQLKKSVNIDSISSDPFTIEEFNTWLSISNEYSSIMLTREEFEQKKELIKDALEIEYRLQKQNLIDYTSKTKLPIKSKIKHDYSQSVLISKPNKNKQIQNVSKSKQSNAHAKDTKIDIMKTKKQEFAVLINNSENLFFLDRNEAVKQSPKIFNVTEKMKKDEQTVTKGNKLLKSSKLPNQLNSKSSSSKDVDNFYSTSSKKTVKEIYLSETDLDSESSDSDDDFEDYLTTTKKKNSQIKNIDDKIRKDKLFKKGPNLLKLSKVNQRIDQHLIKFEKSEEVALKGKKSEEKSSKEIEKSPKEVEKSSKNIKTEKRSKPFISSSDSEETTKKKKNSSSKPKELKNLTSLQPLGKKFSKKRIITESESDEIKVNPHRYSKKKIKSNKDYFSNKLNLDEDNEHEISSNEEIKKDNDFSSGIKKSFAIDQNSIKASHKSIKQEIKLDSNGELFSNDESKSNNSTSSSINKIDKLDMLINDSLKLKKDKTDELHLKANQELEKLSDGELKSSCSQSSSVKRKLDNLKIDAFKLKKNKTDELHLKTNQEPETLSEGELKSNCSAGSGVKKIRRLDRSNNNFLKFKNERSDVLNLKKESRASFCDLEELTSSARKTHSIEFQNKSIRREHQVESSTEGESTISELTILMKLTIESLEQNDQPNVENRLKKLISSVYGYKLKNKIPIDEIDFASLKKDKISFDPNEVRETTSYRRYLKEKFSRL